MDINEKTPLEKKFETTIVLKISIKEKLYSRCKNLMKEKGIKESVLIQMALDNYLLNYNF